MIISPLELTLGLIVWTFLSIAALFVVAWWRS